jgi:hypothetical protein
MNCRGYCVQELKFCILSSVVYIVKWESLQKSSQFNMVVFQDACVKYITKYRCTGRQALSVNSAENLRLGRITLRNIL